MKSKQKQLKIELHTDNFDDTAVFIAGNFNNWNERDENYKMLKIADGHYEFTFDAIQDLPEEIEYKYTKGSWKSEEADNFGCKAPNRFIPKNQVFVSDYVPRWFQDGKGFKAEYLPNIRVIDEAFEIPQLDKTRRVQILLPCDYDSSSRRYPVIYLQDGQNLWDKNAPYGNWGIDEKLAVLKEYEKGDIIVVAIDHGEISRINEFTPRNEIALKIGEREGGRYLQFMVETLKPFIDEHYRTLTQPKYTGIGGSSMGGLISLFGGILHPDTFGKVMVFSPSLWIYDDVYEEVKGTNSLKDVQLYIYAGGRESKGMLPNVHKLMTNIYANDQNTTINFVVNPNGTHSESEWSVAFPEAMEWLFY